MANEVPDRIEMRQFRLFRFPFLNAILAKMAQARLECRFDRLCWKSFRHRDNGDFIRIASAPRRRLSHALAHTFYIFCDEFVVSRHQRDSNMPKLAVFSLHAGSKFSSQFPANSGVLGRCFSQIPPVCALNRASFFSSPLCRSPRSRWLAQVSHWRLAGRARWARQKTS